MNGMTNQILSALSKDAHVGPLDSFLIAIIGIVIVFVVLIVLMFIIWLVGKIMVGVPAFAQKHPEAVEGWKKFTDAVTFKKLREKRKANASEVAAPTGSAQLEILLDEPAPARGSFGELKLINTSERDAAMIMAIVADATDTPLNTLRFKSIKKTDEGEK